MQLYAYAHTRLAVPASGTTGQPVTSTCKYNPSLVNYHADKLYHNIPSGTGKLYGSSSAKSSAFAFGPGLVEDLLHQLARRGQDEPARIRRPPVAACSDAKPPLFSPAPTRNRPSSAQLRRETAPVRSHSALAPSHPLPPTPLARFLLSASRHCVSCCA
eukprot:2118511-Rhodomonas_salina.1